MHVHKMTATEQTPVVHGPNLLSNRLLVECTLVLYPGVVQRAFAHDTSVGYQLY